MNRSRRSFGEELRCWRQRRHLSQLALATEVEISARHLSFMETGRSQASRAMVLRLAERLDVPLRERNSLLIAAGYAPLYAARAYSDPALATVRETIDSFLRAHEPNPALLLDRYWTLVAANPAAQGFLHCLDESLIKPPVNVLRVTLHPKGIASRIENLAEWRTHLLARLARDVDLTADSRLVELLAELRSYPGGEAGYVTEPHTASVIVPLRIRTSDDRVLSFISTTTVFGTAVEVTLSELMLETFYPADEFTAQALRQRAARPAWQGAASVTAQQDA